MRPAARAPGTCVPRCLVNASRATTRFDPSPAGGRVSHASTDHSFRPDVKERNVRDFRHAKAMAAALKDGLAGKMPLSYSESLELVARQFGLSDWNVLAAKIAAAGAPDLDSIRFVQTCPILRIFDTAKARDFYLDYLGFTLDFEHRFEANFPLYMGISRAGLHLHLSEHHGDATFGATVYVRMQNLRAFHQEPQTRPGHGMNPGISDDAPGGPQMQLWDPFGNRLRFAEAQL